MGGGVGLGYSEESEVWDQDKETLRTCRPQGLGGEAFGEQAEEKGGGSHLVAFGSRGAFLPGVTLRNGRW